MPKIHLIKENKIIEVKSLTPLWDISDSQWVEEPNCGGQGRCQKCKCKINGEEKLSCLEKVYNEDLEIETLSNKS